MNYNDEVFSGICQESIESIPVVMLEHAIDSMTSFIFVVSCFVLLMSAVGKYYRDCFKTNKLSGIVLIVCFYCFLLYAAYDGSPKPTDWISIASDPKQWIVDNKHLFSKKQ